MFIRVTKVIRFDGNQRNLTGFQNLSGPINRKIMKPKPDSGRNRTQYLTDPLIQEIIRLILIIRIICIFAPQIINKFH